MRRLKNFMLKDTKIVCECVIAIARANVMHARTRPPAGAGGYTQSARVRGRPKEMRMSQERAQNKHEIPRARVRGRVMGS